MEINNIKIKKTIHRTYKQEVELTVTNVIHDLPTWMFPELFSSSLNHPCIICNKEMGLNIAHGQYIEKCSMVQVDNHAVHAIHTACFKKINQSNPNDNEDNFDKWAEDEFCR